MRIQKNYGNTISTPKLWWLITTLSILSYGTAYFHSNKMWDFQTLSFIAGIIFLYCFISRARLESLVFASFATLPVINSYILIGSFSLTLTDIFTVLFIIRYLLGGQIRISGGFAIMAVGLFMASIASLVYSKLGLASLGMLLRFGILLFFICVIVSRKSEKSFFNDVLLGCLTMPLIACCTYSGESLLFIMAYYNLVEFSKVIYSFQYPIWFAMLLPLVLQIKIPDILVKSVIILVTVICTLSYSRSIYIGFIFGTLIFIIFYKAQSNKQLLSLFIIKCSLFIVIGALLFITIIVFDSFNFSTVASTSEYGNNLQSASTESRYLKMGNTLESVLEYPLLGAGFGADNDEAFVAQGKYENPVFNKPLNSEFGPLNVLSEVGVVGSFFLFAMVIISFNCLIRCLSDRGALLPGKIVVLIAYSGFLSTFLNSNAFKVQLIYFFLAIPVIYHKSLKVSADRFKAPI